MKIAVVGCGAVGSYYGAKLCHAGAEVHFLLRSDFDAVRRNGVFIRSAEGDFTARPRCSALPEQIGGSDLVIIAIKTTANSELRRLISPLVDSSTALLTLQNGLGNEEDLNRLYPAAQIMGGLCFVCINRVEPGVIHHQAHGLVVLGEFQRWPEPRTHDIASMFRNAGVNCKVTSNLARAHWEKLVWNIPFNGLGVASVAGYETLISDAGTLTATLRGPCLTTDKLLADPCWEVLVRELMLEVIQAANALGFSLPDSLAEKQIGRTRGMGAYKASTLIDFERGQPLELENLFLKPLSEAKKAGASVPRLEALCRVLRALDSSAA